QPGMARGNGADLGEAFRCVHHHRNAVVLGLRPEPVGGAIGEPRPVGVAVEGEPHPEHAGLLAPAREHVLAGLLERDASHDRETVGIGTYGLECVVVAVGVERGRHQDGAVDAGAVHVADEIFVSVRLALADAAAEAAIRPVGRPHVHLRVDDHHAAGSRQASATTRLRSTPMPVISISIMSPCLTLPGTSSVPSQTTSLGESVLVRETALMTSPAPNSMLPVGNECTVLPLRRT